MKKKVNKKKIRKVPYTLISIIIIITAISISIHSLIILLFQPTYFVFLGRVLTLIQAVLIGITASFFILSKFKTLKSINKESLPYLKITKRTVFIITGVFLFLVLVLFSSLAFFNFYEGGAARDLSTLNFGGIYGTILNLNDRTEKVEPLIKTQALKLTEKCQSDYCKARVIYNYLDDFNYENGIDTLSPLKILEERTGDCDEVSYLYLRFLRSLEIKASIQCYMPFKYGTGHCWVVIHLDDMDIKADLTIKGKNIEWVEFPKEKK